MRLIQFAELVCKSLATAPFGIVVLDNVGRCIEANDTFLEQFNHSLQSLRESNMDSMLSLRGEWKGAFDSALDGQVARLEVGGYETNGFTGGLWQVQLFSFSVGSERGVWAIFEDTSEMAQLKDAFKASEDGLRLLIHEVSDAIVIHRSQVILFVNPAGVRLLQYESPDGLIGRPFTDLVAEGHIGSFLSQMNRREPCVAPSRLYSTFRKRNGRPQAVIYELSNAFIDGSEAGLVIFRPARVEHSPEVQHDGRAAIWSRLARALGVEWIADLERLQQLVDRALTLDSSIGQRRREISELLAAARTRALELFTLPNAIASSRESTSVEPLLESVRARAAANHIDLQIDSRADEIRLLGPFQAYEKLIGDLVQATARFDSPIQAVRISSIDPATSEPARLFEMTITAVRQIDAAPRGSQQIGRVPIGSQEQSHDLRILAAIAETSRLGGFIDFWLDVRGGLCFSLGLLLDRGDRCRADVQAAEGIMQERANTTNGEIPEVSAVDVERATHQSGLVHADEASPSTMRSPASSPDRTESQTRVLICDDETRLVTLTASLLREIGYQVLTVKSGEEAVECVRRESVDVVILDVNLPGEDTLSVARQLIQNHAPAIVLSSGFTEEDVESELLSLPGVRAFLAKPYGIEALASAIRSVVGRAQIVE